MRLTGGLRRAKRIFYDAMRALNEWTVAFLLCILFFYVSVYGYDSSEQLLGCFCELCSRDISVCFIFCLVWVKIKRLA